MENTSCSKEKQNTNETKDPELSILVCNYSGTYLGQCMESILAQNIITDFEIILIDDATCDGTWDITLEFLRHYPNRITFQRNRFPCGLQENLRKARAMARGTFCTTLTAHEAFEASYIKQAIEIMKHDAHAVCRNIYRREQPFTRYKYFMGPSIMNQPLVSILCYNYNYGRYLEQSISSVFNQTYKNIELCFSDNGSTDESWEIALTFARRYPHHMWLVRNRSNFGVDANFANCFRNMNGKYYINFCSDDVLAKDYVEKCVDVLETHSKVGMVIVHRSIIDALGQCTQEPPFYNQSCIIPGRAQAAVYMMAGVNPSVSQIMYRSDIVRLRRVKGGLAARYYGTRILDFNISLDYDVAYLKEPLLFHRLHPATDTTSAESNLLPVIGWYVLNHQLADLASVRHEDDAVKRLPESIEKLAQLATRYATRALLSRDEELARRYFHLAVAMSPQICNDPHWKQLASYWDASPATQEDILQTLRSTQNLVSRSVSYDPPPGSIPLKDTGSRSLGASFADFVEPSSVTPLRSNCSKSDEAARGRKRSHGS